MGEYENLDPQEREEVDDIANSLCEDLFGEKEKKKGGWPKGKKRKAAVINQEFEEMFQEKGKIAPAQFDTGIPVEVIKACETRVEWLSTQISEMEAQTNEIESLISKFKEECKILVDFIVQKGQ